MRVIPLSQRERALSHVGKKRRDEKCPIDECLCSAGGSAHLQMKSSILLGNHSLALGRVPLALCRRCLSPLFISSATFWSFSPSTESRVSKFYPEQYRRPSSPLNMLRVKKRCFDDYFKNIKQSSQLSTRNAPSNQNRSLPKPSWRSLYF